jgi:diguanylate cyclase (GGDEF)-like protein
MSLIRQIWVLLFATLALAFLGSVTVNVDTSRESLQTQLRLKNSDNAASLAMVLSQQQGDADSMALLMTAQFDTGFYQRVRFIGSDGKVKFQREASAVPAQAPAWFVEWVGLDSISGLAQVSDGWRALGSVEVQSHAAFAHDELWRGSLRSAAALAGVGALAGLLAFLGVGQLRRPLDEAVEQARALERGEYVTLPEPRMPELRRLTRAMNSMVTRLKLVFEGQASQVETLRRQANCDRLTGLSNRTHFLGQLSTALQREERAAHGGLVILRVIELAEVNRVLGHVATDQMLMAIGQVLQTYTQRGDGCLVGRLNGSDFALGLPVGGMAEETAQALAGALRAALPAFGPNIGVALGAVEISRAMLIAELMNAADMALARAEARGAFAVELEGQVLPVAAGLGEGAWRQHIQAALAAGRLELGEVPVHGSDRRLVHIECPLRLQLEPEGPFEVAARWLPLAIRGRLTTEIDTAAVTSALRAIVLDGRPRCINIALASLADIEFIPRLAVLLADSAREARHLWIEVGESAAIDQFSRVRELGRQLRPLGVKLGLKHAGERLSRIERLFDAGLDFVKLDTAITMGVASDSNRAAFIRGVVAMLHSVSIQVYAEGVGNAADSQTLELGGIDGFAESWVGALSASMPA